MRLALLAPTSIDMAVPICAAPTASPIITRRTGLSVAQPMPLMKLATARCQTASRCRCASGRQSERRDHHADDDDDQRGAPLHAFGDGAEEGAEQTHRQQPQHGHHGDDERRTGVLVDEHADRDGLHPADDEHDETDEPEAPEIRAVDQPGRAAGRPGRQLFPARKGVPRRFSLRLCLGW